VMGLPLREVVAALARFGVSPQTQPSMVPDVDRE